MSAAGCCYFVLRDESRLKEMNFLRARLRGRVLLEQAEEDSGG